MASGEPKPMSDVQRAAFEVYRDLGPARTLKAAAKLLDKSESLLRGYSSELGWTRLITEHDYAGLREALGKREMDKEHATQIVVDAQGSLIAEALDIARDKRVLPILDRGGEHLKDPDGNALYKPVTRQSTRLESIKWLTGLVGHVPVKRTEIVNKTDEDIDELAAMFESVHPDDLDEFMDILRRRKEADDR